MPGNAAQAIELRAGLFRAVTRQHLDVLDRHEQAVVAGIKHFQAIMRRARDIERLEPLVAADAVLSMDDKIAGGERPRLGNEIIEVAAAPRRPRETVAENVLLAEQGQRVGCEALFERQDREPDRRGR